MKGKKINLLFTALFAAAFISACNKPADKEGEKEKAPPETPVIEEEEIVIPELSDEAFYERVHDALTAAGLTINAPLEAPVRVFDAEGGMTLIINNETILPLHLYKLRADDARLAAIKETGTIQMAIGSKKEKLDILESGEFIMYVHQGHPDYDQIISIISQL